VVKIFGANWQTSVSGLIVIAAGVIYATPDLIAFLPDSFEPTIKGVAGLIAAVSAAWFAIKAKDKNVTGGSVQQTLSGDVAKPGTQTLVDDTAKATIASGEVVAPEILEAVKDTKP
jgi:hypothetical protein